MKLDIEALDDQAEKIADEKCQMPGEYHPDWHSVHAEAFARLIVERCAEECDVVSSSSDFPDLWRDAATDIGVHIRNLLED